MSSLPAKAAYVKGLADGLDITPGTKESKLLLAIVDALSEMAEAIVKIESSQNELDEYVNSIDQDVRDMEAVLMEEFGEEDSDDDEAITYTCPHCDAEITIEAGTLSLESDPNCPECGHPLFEDSQSDR